MKQIDFNLEKTSSQKTDEKSNNEIEVLKGKGSKQEIKLKERAKKSCRNNLPGVELK